MNERLKASETGKSPRVKAGIALRGHLPFDAFASPNSSKAVLDTMENVETVSWENLVLKMLLPWCHRGASRQ